MHIKKHQERASRIGDLGVAIWRRRHLRLSGALLVALVGFVLGAYLQRSGVLPSVSRLVRQKLELVRDRNFDLVAAVGSGLLASPERLVISIKFEHVEKLRRQRAEALAAGVLAVSNDDYVPATLAHDGKSIPVRMRLKGDLTDHLEQGDKWSFRIRAKGDNTFFGMKQFSLHHPNTRNYVYEWLFHRALQREDVLALRYDFVTVTLNGKDLGVYALEEHFEKRLIEHRRRREGPVIRFSEERLWEDWRQQKIPFPGARQGGGGSYLASDIDAFQTQRWFATEADRAVHDKALRLLESFRVGELSTSEVFDVPSLARFLAITDLLGAEHGARWHNTRFYYNPVTSRLEPIGFDGDAGKRVMSLVYHLKDRHWSDNAWSSDPNYLQSLFADRQLVAEYVACLSRISAREYLDQLFAEIQPELKEKLRVIHREDPAFVFRKDTLYRNQRYIRSVLNPDAAVAAYLFETPPGSAVLRIGNLQGLPLEAVGVTVKGQACAMDKANVDLAGRHPSALVEYQDIEVELPKDMDWSDELLPETRVLFRVVGAREARSVPVLHWPFAETAQRIIDVMRRAPNVADFDFVRVDEGSRSVKVQPGVWTVSNDMVVPEGYTFQCGPGTRLELMESAMIVSYSALRFIGEEADPIMIDSPDGTGQGLLVMKVAGSSTLENVVFSNMAFPSRPGWALTGSVTFYESPLLLRGCKFVNNAAEDALNVIRTRFQISDCSFTGALSDAFDGDFCVGVVQNTTFRQCGNDAVDVSGSTVELQNVRVAYAGDKGVSVGENSRVSARNVSVERSRVGVAVKDQSHFEAEGFRISETKIGCAAYRKKPEFGPSSGVLNGVTMHAVDQPHLIELDSVLHVNGVEIEGSVRQVSRTLELEQSSDGASVTSQKRDPRAG